MMNCISRYFNKETYLNCEVLPCMWCVSAKLLKDIRVKENAWGRSVLKCSINDKL